MPNMKPADDKTLDAWEQFKWLTVPREEIDQAIEDGATLYLVESAFTDPGPDSSHLFLKQEDPAGHVTERPVGFCPSY